jgi:hypothetical protein
MALAWRDRHFHAGAHHRFWLLLAAMMAFLMALLWAQPVR